MSQNQQDCEGKIDLFFFFHEKIMVDFVEICRQETDIAFPPLEPELTQSFDHNEDIRSIYGMFLQPLVPNTILVYLEWVIRSELTL